MQHRQGELSHCQGTLKKSSCYLIYLGAGKGDNSKEKQKANNRKILSQSEEKCLSQDASPPLSGRQTEPLHLSMVGPKRSHIRFRPGAELLRD